MTDQNKTHGVLTDAEIHDLGLIAMQAGWPDAEFARVIEVAVLEKVGVSRIAEDRIYDLLSEIASIDTHDINLRDHPDAYAAVEAAVLAKAAPQSPVAPAVPQGWKVERRAHQVRVTSPGGTVVGFEEFDKPSGFWYDFVCAILDAAPVAPADEREAFEAACHERAKANGRVFEPHYFCWHETENRYINARAESGWQGWQARARLADAPTVSATVPVPKCSRCGHFGHTGWHCGGRSSHDGPLYAAPTLPTSAADALPNVQRLIDAHAKLIEDGNNYAYFELAYTRHTEWMAWLCTNAREHDPERKVIAKGQGSTPDEACLAAIAASKESGDE